MNGSKIWTSGAQHADRCYCLVRTDTAKKHEGISFLLIDMKSPGVEPRPILLINGTTPFCETFFTDVKVPKENLVGPLNGGWTIAKRLMQFERDSLTAQAEQAAAAAQNGALSRERIADELRMMLTAATRVAAWKMLTIRPMISATSSIGGASAAASNLVIDGATFRYAGRVKPMGASGGRRRASGR